MCGEDGSPLSDAAGDIALIRPLEGRSVSEDSALWRHRVDGAIDEALMGMAGIMACVRPELLSFVPEGRRESYARLFMECLSDARDRTRLELEALARREERSFVARRTADMNSLKRKSDATSASAIADELSAGAVEACASGIAALNAHIEAARGNPEELNLAGQAWLEEFERQFQRGMASWQAAEERFMARRLEWELDSISSFRAGEEEWSRAFGRLEKERSAWETRLYAQLEEGEKAFAKAHGDLESSIRTARSEFERDSMQRRSVSVEKAQAWASVYIQSAAAAANARESVDYWLLELGGIRPEGDYTDLKAWLKAGMEDDPPGSQAGKARGEALRWLDLLGSCTSRAKEAAEALFQCFGVAIGDDVSSLRVFMDVGADPGAFKLDEYQVELFRAKAVQGYWERRVTIAEAVASYASELGAARLTEAEVILELEWASSLYAAALSDYRELVEELGAMSEKEREKREELAGKASLLKKAGTALQEINARYSRALGALSLSGAGYLLDEALRKYRELLECSVFSEGSLPPGQAASMALYLERGAAYGIETTMASAEDSMKSALEGEDGEPSLRELKARYDSVWAGAEGEEIPGDIAGFGVEGDPVARRTLQALLSLAETSESEAFSLGISEALRAAARSAKERARLRLEARLDGISLLANGSPESWYLERSGRPCAEDLPWERYLEGQASESARCAALAKALLERDALLAVLGPEASATLPAEATFTLEAWWKGTKEEARRGVDALDAYISILEGMAGRDIHDFTESLSLLHATNERAYAYALGEGFFMLGDIDLSALLEGPDMARAVRDCGLLEAFRRWSSTALSFEKNRQDTILDSLKNAFSLAGLGGLIEVDTTMPSVREIGEALAMTEPGFSETAMALARAVGEASARVPVWLGDILNRWAKRFLDYCAAKCLYDGLVETRNLDQILRELDELDQRIRHAREEGTPIAAELEADRIKLLGERDFSSRVQSLRDAEEAARESGKKHWRESILAPDFSENASGLVLPGDPEGPAACGMRAAASWYEGLLADLAYDLHACGELFSSALAAWRGTGQGLEDRKSVV